MDHDHYREGRHNRKYAAVGLTPRQEQIMRLICQGKNNAQIAIELGLSVQTIKNHLVWTYQKLNARNRREAIVIVWGKYA